MVEPRGRANETSLFPCMVARASPGTEADIETTVTTNSRIADIEVRFVRSFMSPL